MVVWTLSLSSAKMVILTTRAINLIRKCGAKMLEQMLYKRVLSSCWAYGVWYRAFLVLDNISIFLFRLSLSYDVTILLF